MYLRNCWYAAAWSHEVKHFDLFSRSICEEKIVFYRDNDDEVVALLDKCPHRFYPLSKGRITEAGIECGYHGLVFNSDGECTHIPTQDIIPKTACVKSYPLIEKYNLIWIWMGDPELADKSLMPKFETGPGWRQGLDFSCLSSPEWDSTGGEIINVKANYQLIVDNLLDLSHAAFIHATTFAGSEIDKAEVEIDVIDNIVHDFRTIRNTKLTPFNKVCNKDITDPVDRWSNTYWTAPGTMILDHGFTESEKSFDDGARWFNVNIITPETAETSHYFWSQCRWHDNGNTALTDYWRTATIEAFAEDEDALQEQQENLTFFNIDEITDHHPVTLGSDKSAKLARTVLSKLIKAEQEAG